MKIKQIVGYLVIIIACGGFLLFLTITGWIFYTASGADEKFNRMNEVIISIHEECNKLQQCPSTPAGWSKISENSARHGQFRYDRGYYAEPDYEKTDLSYKTRITGNEYFHIIYIPVMDIGFHASGGKDVELLFWKQAEGSLPEKLD